MSHAAFNRSFASYIEAAWLLRLFAMFKPELNDIVARLGRNKKASNVKSKKTIEPATR